MEGKDDISFLFSVQLVATEKMFSVCCMSVNNTLNIPSQRDDGDDDDDDVIVVVVEVFRLHTNMWHFNTSAQELILKVQYVRNDQPLS